VRNDFYQSWLEENYLSYIREAIAHVAGGKIYAIKFAVERAARATLTEPVRESSSHGSPKPSRAASRKRDEPLLNRQHIFESFVVGPSNRFAHAAALAVAQSPGRAYNPLFIYGNSALGKTHLLQAVGNYVLSNTQARICYVPCESLLNEYVTSIQNKTTHQFREKYRRVDVFLVDDVHFLSHKDGLQEEFFHTFNALHNEFKQIVMTSDRPANEIEGLAGNLVTRFQWGLMAEITPPDFETRMAILKSKQQGFRMTLPDEALEFIAGKIKSNVRALEGALRTAVFHASMMNAPMTVTLLEAALREMIAKESAPAVTIDLIQKKVADCFDVRLADMTSKRRSQAVAMPRQVAMYLARTLTPSSLPEIGNAFGKTHATVLHSYRQVHNRMNRDDQFRQLVQRLTGQITSERTSAAL
jgi:chromosomal replication initiator protein